MASDPILPVELDTILNPEFRNINSKRPGHGCQQAHLTSVLMAGYYDKDGAGTFRELRLVLGPFIAIHGKLVEAGQNMVS